MSSNYCALGISLKLSDQSIISGQGESASIMFYGNAVTLYGLTAYYHGLFSLSLDNSYPPLVLNGTTPMNVLRFRSILVSGRSIWSGVY